MGIPRFFSPPVFADSEQTQRARTLHVILWSTMLVVTTQMIVGIFVLPENTARWVTVILVVDLIHPILMQLNHRGFRRAAGIALLAELWLLVVLLAFWGGGIEAPAVTGFVVIALIAGLVFGEAAGVAAGIVGALAGLALVILEVSGHLPASTVTHTPLSLWVALVLYIGLIVSFQFLANRSIKHALRQAREELRQRRQTERALRESEEALRRSRDELELRVQERTAELQAVNRELESFAHSVSHDLRAPLRAVSGFSNILIEEYSREMPSKARRLLAIVKSSAGRMEHLIEDLLKLCRAGRQEVLFRPVNLNALVRDTIEELRAENKDRLIDLRLAELPECIGDTSLLKQVFLNLLSNAFKFTRQCEKAVIEVGSRTREDGETIYFVRDNGAGFDMKYAARLFGVFQRLHSENEFEGTGVGLSIVQRIITRHGGRIWAESAVDRGATFYFTLPRPGSEAIASAFGDFTPSA